MNNRWRVAVSFGVIPAAMATLTAAAFADDAPRTQTSRVAVFSQFGFPYYNSSSSLSPARIAADLKAAGIKADLLDVSALSDPEKFNDERYAAVVFPYGNTFPQDAFANLKTFHKSGGIFVLSGVPFTHPIVRTTSKSGEVTWDDKGHSDPPGLYGPNGIGVGTFGNVSNAPIEIAPDDLLGLKSLNRTWAGGSQPLDVSRLPKENVVTPILTQGGSPLAAIIEHNDPQYRGAIDVWTHHADSGDLDAYDNEQMLVRGTIVALEKKKLVSSKQRKQAFAKWDTIVKPKLYAGLTLPTPPRPYETFQPTGKAPAEHLYVVDARKLQPDERLLLNSLQGIVNREQPRIYLLIHDNDEFWLEQLQKQGQTGAPITVKDPLSLLKTFASDYKGAVVTDPKIYVSPHVAVGVAGIEDQVIASPRLAKQLGLQVKTDLRGKFKDDAAAYRYVRTELLPRMNPYIAISGDAPLDAGALDQIIAARGMALWITGPKEQNKPGADQAAETEEVKAIFAQLPLNSVMRGFWYAGGPGNGIDEGPGVSLASRFGKVTIVTDLVTNFSVFGGAKAPALHQKFAPPPTLDPTKVYVSLAVSDGDNLCTWQNNFRDYFEDPLHGTFPVAWGMGPTLIDVAPSLTQWYYDHATPNDEFICDVSGVGYIAPADWATALDDREGALKSFYDWTQQYMTRLDMKTLRLMYVNQKDIAKVGELMPDVKFLFPDYGYTDPKLTYELPSGQTVFRAATGGSLTDFTQQIREHAGKSRPAFVNAFVINWGMKLGDLKKTLDDLGPEFVPVTPSQLNALYDQAKAANQITVVK